MGDWRPELAKLRGREACMGGEDGAEAWAVMRLANL